jgi:hypothetical protein
MIFLMIGVVAFTSEQVFGDPEQRATERAILSQTVVYGQTQAPTLQSLRETVENIDFLETQSAQVAANLVNAQGTQTALILTPFESLPTLAPPTVAFSADVASTFTDTALASSINETNGCATGYQQTFQVGSLNDPTRIYLTTVGHQVRAGMEIRTRWYADSDPTNSFDSVSWSPTINHEQICIYFWLESSNIPYSSGTWTAELIVDGMIVETTPFVICNTAEETC